MSGPAPPPAHAVARPPEGEAAEVAPGVLWARMALPLKLDHINLWLLEDGDGWTVVDTGFGDARTRATWGRLERTALGGRPVTRVVSTHYHPDHIGLAGWLVERWDAEFAASLTEWLYGRMASLESVEAYALSAARFYRRAGVPADVAAPLLEQAGSYRASVVALPPSLRRLRDGDELVVGGVPWQVVIGRGHSPEHVCLYAPEPRVLIAGDQVLPKITPNVSVWPAEPDADPLTDFLETGERLKSTIPDDVLVLPSHKAPFRGLHRRLDELAAHHRARLDDVVAHCDEPRTAYEVTRSMFDQDLDMHQLTFALGEGLAHLNHLVRQGQVARRRVRGEPDRFVRTA